MQHPARFRTVATLLCALLAAGASCEPAPTALPPPAPSGTSSGASASPTQASGGIILGGEATGPCHVDADCVPASCCHATACMPAAQAPQCSGVSCTGECRGGTLDCNGTCACQAGACVAQIGRPPGPPAPPR
jgi:hypothetical protein